MTREDALKNFVATAQAEVDRLGLGAKVTFRKDSGNGPIFVGITDGEKRRALAVNPPFDGADFGVMAMMLCEFFGEDKAAA